MERALLISGVLITASTASDFKLELRYSSSKTTKHALVLMASAEEPLCDHYQLGVNVETQFHHCLGETAGADVPYYREQPPVPTRTAK